MRVVPSISPILLEVNEGVLGQLVLGFFQILLKKCLQIIQILVEDLASVVPAKIKTGNNRNSRNSEPLGNIKTKSSLGVEYNDNDPATVTDRDELLRKIEM